MLTPFLKDVCMRGYHIMSLCVIFKTWIETFACPDIAECCHENPEQPGHGGQLVTYVPPKESLKSRLLLSRTHNYDMNTIKLITSEYLRSCIQKKFGQNQDSQQHRGQHHTDTNRILYHDFTLPFCFSKAIPCGRRNTEYFLGGLSAF